MIESTDEPGREPGSDFIPPPLPIRRCPQCGYRGEGVPYFRRPSRIAALIGISVFTYGIGGLVYWLVRRKDRVCPNCGLKWEYALRASRDDLERQELVPRDYAGDTESLPSGGGFRRVLGVVGLLASGGLLFAGVLEAEAATLLGGALTGAGSGLMFWWGWRALQNRREVLTGRLQRKVLLLAARKGGTLTVTETAASLDLSLEAAERILISMDDGFRVRSEITREGMLLYEFPEIQLRALPKSDGGAGKEEGGGE